MKMTFPALALGNLSRRRVACLGSEFESGLAWYGRNRDAIDTMNESEIVQSFLADNQQTWTDGKSVIAARFHDAALTGSPESFMPSAKEQAQRLAEMDKMTADKIQTIIRLQMPRNCSVSIWTFWNRRMIPTRWTRRRARRPKRSSRGPSLRKNTLAIRWLILIE